MEEISKQDLKENVVMIRINKAYHDGMSANELYDATRGIWRRKIESVEHAEYAFAVYKGIVKEVYKINRWFCAEGDPYHEIEWRPKCKIAFEGFRDTSEIRDRYLNKSVASFFPRGSANPVITFEPADAQTASSTANAPLENEYDQMSDTIDQNTILFGPPGTGKTYSTTIYAVAIIENKTVDELNYEIEESGYDAVKQRFNDYKEKGLIAFTTFHQSYGYEDFIEGIRPVLTEDTDDSEVQDVSYKIHDGTFKEFCNRAKLPVEDNNFGLNLNPVVWKVSLEGTGDNATRRECLENGHIRIGWDNYGPQITENTEYKEGGRQILDAFINKMRIGDIVLSCYSATETDAIGVITGEPEWNDDFPNFKRVRKVRWLVKRIRENILRLNDNSNMTLSTVYKMRISASDAMEIVRKYSTASNLRPSGSFVFIIDEINRGNISKIFGELITLIEPGRRIGEKEETRVKLPYSGTEFGVPSNVYILGTMNTADRSIALLDTALRRRFSFREMMPDCELLKGIKITQGEQTLDVGRMLEIINQRIECLYDREHTIGHAYFMQLKENPTIKVLASIFENKIIPLLQEYFYEDYRKIQLVLGDNGKENPKHKFIVDLPGGREKIFGGNIDLQEFVPDVKYQINPDAFSTLASYIGIFPGRSDEQTAGS